MKDFESLYEELAAKAAAKEEGSATVEALDKGIHAVGKKIVEEAAEVWMAGEYQSDGELAEEISQLLYWCQVMMIARGLTPADVHKYL